MKSFFSAGDWNVICDVCGFKFKSDKIRERWDGLKVCKADWEPRHPQELRRAHPDKQTVPYSRPRPADVFVPVATLDGRSAVAGYAQAGVSVNGMPRLDQ